MSLSSRSSCPARFAIAGPQVLRLEHDGLAAVGQDLADQPVARADAQRRDRGSVGQRRRAALDAVAGDRLRVADAHRCASSRKWGSKPSRGSNDSSVSRAERIRSSRNERSPSAVRSQVWMIQFGSTRSNVYGSTSRSDGVSSPSFR